MQSLAGKRLKRIFDLFISLTVLFLLSPVFLISPFLIKILMPGPVFFVQSRIGLNGKPFSMYKFRSMQEKPGALTGTFGEGDNSRTTSFGKILRKSKIDELPQLFNVIKGEMSIVGPRPEVPEWTEVYPEKWKIVHQVKPGISDYASILFRNEEEILAASENPSETYRNVILPQKLNLYIEYVNNHSVCGDLLIILKTIVAVFLKY